MVPLIHSSVEVVLSIFSKFISNVSWTNVIEFHVEHHQGMGEGGLRFWG